MAHNRTTQKTKQNSNTDPTRNRMVKQILNKQKSISNKMDKQILNKQKSISNRMVKQILNKQKSISNSMVKQILNKQKSISKVYHMETTWPKCPNLPFTMDQLLATGLWFSPGTPVSSTNKTDRHDISDIVLKVVLITIILHLHCNKYFLASLLARVVFKH